MDFCFDSEYDGMDLQMANGELTVTFTEALWESYDIQLEATAADGRGARVSSVGKCDEDADHNDIVCPGFPVVRIQTCDRTLDKGLRTTLFDDIQSEIKSHLGKDEDGNEKEVTITFARYGKCEGRNIGYTVKLGPGDLACFRTDVWHNVTPLKSGSRSVMILDLSVDPSRTLPPGWGQREALHADGCNYWYYKTAEPQTEQREHPGLKNFWVGKRSNGELYYFNQKAELSSGGCFQMHYPEYPVYPVLSDARAAVTSSSSSDLSDGGFGKAAPSDDDVSGRRSIEPSEKAANRGCKMESRFKVIETRKSRFTVVSRGSSQTKHTAAKPLLKLEEAIANA